MMDFNDLLNTLFMKDAECRKRNLRIRTYVSFQYVFTCRKLNFNVLSLHTLLARYSSERNQWNDRMG